MNKNSKGGKVERLWTVIRKGPFRNYIMQRGEGGGYPLSYARAHGVRHTGVTCFVLIYIVIRYKVCNEQHTRAGLNIQHVIY